MTVAHEHLDRLNISLRSRVSKLSGGQQAQVALTVCLAKEPDLLLLDEPAAALDPVAREDLLRLLMRQVADSGSSVILSTHSLNDVAAICDYVVVLAHSRVVLADDIEFVLESHRLISSLRDSEAALPDGAIAVEERNSARQTASLVRVELPLSEAGWKIEQPTLEEIVKAYLRAGVRSPREGDEFRLENRDWDMTWTAWRRARSIIIAMSAVVVIVVVVLFVTGSHLELVWNEYLRRPCRGRFPTGHLIYCEHVVNKLHSATRYNAVIANTLVALGPLFGLVLGVNAVAQEIERRTVRLSWTQSGSRQKWLASTYLVNLSTLVVLFVRCAWWRPGGIVPITTHRDWTSMACRSPDSPSSGCRSSHS